MVSFAKRLTKLKDNWNKSKPAKGVSALPKGKYQFVIKKAVMGEGKMDFNKGHIVLTYTLAVAVGPMKNRTAFINVDLESDGLPDKNVPPGMDIFKGHLDTLEIDMPKTLTDKALKKTLEEMIGVMFEGQCVHSKSGFPNVYINGLIHAPEEEDDDEEEVEEDEEDEEEEEDEDEEEDEEDDEEDGDEDPPPKKKSSKKKGGFAVKKKSSKKEVEEDDEEVWDDDEFEDDDDEDE